MILCVSPRLLQEHDDGTSRLQVFLILWIFFPSPHVENSNESVSGTEWVPVLSLKI